MSKHNKRWGRLNEFNEFVEFTFEDPTGRFHPDLVWLEVGPTTPYRAKLNVFGLIENPTDLLEFKDDYFKEKEVILEKEATETEDRDASLHAEWVKAEEKSKTLDTRFNATVESDYS